MDALPPYEIHIYNRAAQHRVGTYRSNQVPRIGDQVSFYGPRVPDDPFDLWGQWKVDDLVWLVSQEGSQNARELMRTHKSRGEAACLGVELHVWPTEGPHFSKMTKWATALTAPLYRVDAEESD